MKTRGDLIVVHWYDIQDDSSWRSITAIENSGSPLCKSVGWFLSEDAMCLRILYSMTGVDSIEAGSVIIPKHCIRDIEVIRDDELETE